MTNKQHQALEVALKLMQHMAKSEHPYHRATLPGELEMAIEIVHQALEEPQFTLIGYFHPLSQRVRLGKQVLHSSWKPIYIENK